ncbi:hypothetical protein GCM10022221_16190 [Actinocorallia aurea]
MLRARFALPVVLSCLAPLLAACGAPSYHYVKNSEDKTYFKVPATWHRIEEQPLNLVVGGADADSATAARVNATSWSVGFDADGDPSAGHLVDSGSDAPFVYANVRPLSEEQRGVISLNMLRDLFLPVTETSRTAAEQGGNGLPGFELLRDEILTPGEGLRGVRVVYSYDFTLGLRQTFDQTAYTSDDGRLFWLVIRCSARCFSERADELDSIATSFTVRN